VQKVPKQGCAEPDARSQMSGATPEEEGWMQGGWTEEFKRRLKGP